NNPARRIEHASARDCTDLPVRRDPANAIVVRVGNEDGFVFIDCNANRPIEARLGGWAINISGAAVATDRRNVTRGRNTANAIIAGVRDINISVRIERQTRRRVESRGRSSSISKAFRATGESTHDTFGRDPANAITPARIRDVDRTLASDCYSEWIGETRFRRLLPVAHERRTITCKTADVSAPAYRRRQRLSRHAIEEKRQRTAGDEQECDNDKRATHRSYSLRLIAAWPNNSWTRTT